MRKSLLFAIVLMGIASFGQSQTVDFQHEGLQINARLQLPPNGTPPYKAIVIMPGTGANDRNGTFTLSGGNSQCLYPGLLNQTLAPYLGLSNALSDSGYAVLTYDKVEYTYPLTMGPITFDKLWMPVASALQYLKSRNDIDTNNLVLIGHSEGGAIIPYIARQEPQVKALISLAGPRRPLDSLLAYQLVFIADSCNGDVNAAQQSADQILQYCQDVRTGNYNSMTPPLFGVPANVWNKYFKVVDSVSHHYNSFGGPKLFVGMEDDINVPVSTELVRLQQEVAVADFYQIAGINHYLTTASDPAVSEAVTDTIVYWLRTKVFTSVKETKAETFSYVVRNGAIRISFESAATRELELYDLNGKQLLSNKFQELQADIPTGDLPGGMYILKVRSRNGYSSLKLVLPGS